MHIPLLQWDIYEIQTEESPINGVMLRGRIRKFGLERKQNILTENTQDVAASVRFAVLAGEDASAVQEYLHAILPDVTITLVRAGVPNPVLSKLKINSEDRYTLY